MAQDKLPAGRVRRAAPLVGSTVRSALGRGVGLLRPGKELDLLLKEAERYAAVLGDMKGAAMKLGQLLSFLDAGLVPEAYRPAYQQVLATLRADAPAMSFDAVKAVLEDELGPIDDRFTWVAPHPMAAASIGQVHAAEHVDGREIVLKIQYPGAADAVRADLANGKAMAAVAQLGKHVLGPLTPALDINQLMDEVSARVGEELDYTREAANQQDFFDRFAGDPVIRIPAVHHDLSTARVLAQEHVDGMRWDAALEADQDLRDQWGQVIYSFVYRALYAEGLFNGDPHPGNYLFHDDGGVTFLDFGCVVRFPPGRCDQFRDLAEVMMAGDVDGLRRSFVALGLLPAKSKVDPQRLFDWYSLPFEPVLAEQPFTYTPEYAARVVAATYDPLSEWGDVIRTITVPADLVFLNRIQLGLNSVLGGLRATADWRALADDIRSA